MRKRIMIGLLAMGIVATWGTDASATNRINGILIKHGSPWSAEITLTGAPAADTLITVAGTVRVEIICLGPQGQGTGNPEQQDADITTTRRVTNENFDGTGHAVVTLEFNLEGTECQQNNFQKVLDSELIISLSIVTAWKACNGKEPGPDRVNDGDACFEFRGTVETVRSKPIEAVATTCGAGIRRADGTVPMQELPCESVHHIEL
jgi:hypothetical protein